VEPLPLVFLVLLAAGALCTDVESVPQSMEKMASAKRCIVLGSTGAVGRLLIKTLAQDPRVSGVTAVVRKQQDVPFWLLEGDTASLQKFKQLVVPDLAQVDSFEKEFAGHDCFISAMGLYSGDVKDEASFEKVEIGLNEGTARVAAKGGATVGAYLSGMGVVKPNEVGYFTPMFSRVKGKAEAAIERIFSMGLCARPGGIYDRILPGIEKRFYDHFNDGFRFVFENTQSLGISAPDIAKAMVQATVVEPLNPIRSVENAELKTLARAYEQGLAAARGKKVLVDA